MIYHRDTISFNGRAFTNLKIILFRFFWTDWILDLPSYKPTFASSVFSYDDENANWQCNTLPTYPSHFQHASNWYCMHVINENDMIFPAYSLGRNRKYVVATAWMKDVRLGGDCETYPSNAFHHGYVWTGGSVNFYIIPYVHNSRPKGQCLCLWPSPMHVLPKSQTLYKFARRRW